MSSMGGGGGGGLKHGGRPPGAVARKKKQSIVELQSFINNTIHHRIIIKFCEMTNEKKTMAITFLTNKI